MTDQDKLELMAKALRIIQQVLAPIVESIGERYDGYVGDIPVELECCQGCYWKACEALKAAGMPMDLPVFPKIEPAVVSKPFRPSLPE